MRKSQARTGHRPLKVGATAAVAAAAVLAAPAGPAFAAYSVSTTQVAVAGGTLLTLTGGTAFTDAMGIRYALSTNSCPSNYNTTQTGAVNGGLIDARSGTVAVVSTPALPAATYKTCIYADATTGAANAETTADTITSVNMGTLSATTGRAADRITLTAASAIFTAASYSTQFISGVAACPTTFSAASGTIITGTTAKTSTTVLTITVPTITAGLSYLICNYAGTTAGTSALASRGKQTFMSYDATLPTVTLAPTGGSSGTATTVTVTAVNPIFTGTPAALLSFNSCPTTYAAGATNLEPFAATTTKISTTKLAVTMPTSIIVAGSDVTTPWNLCVYASSSSGALVTAPTPYNVAPVLTVSGAQFAVGSGSASPTGSGPAQGGSTLTVSGLTGIPTAAGATLTATLGGSPIDDITPIDATSFSGTTTAHAAGLVNLSVTTAAGSKSTTNSPYTYTYGITVSPNTAASNTTPVLDILGAGFSTLTFGTVADGVALDSDNSDGATAYVFLTDNAWNAQDFSVAKDALATKAVTYCNTVLPISDGEIICTLDLGEKIASVTTNTPTFDATADPGDAVSSGTYTVTVVNAGEELLDTEHNYSIVSSGSTFTVSPY